MHPSKLEWYLRRLQRMSTQEVFWRVSDYARQQAWRRQQVLPPSPGAPVDGVPQVQADARIVLDRRRFRATLPDGVLGMIPPTARVPVTATADEVLAGRWPMFGMIRDDLESPDWFLDPGTGIRAPQSDYCFRIDHRDVEVTGNVKRVWELSRLHHVTVLACAYALSREERYAEGAARHLRSWWQQNPFLSGVHWTSGIEVGLRLLSWVWVRRLLQGWKEAPRLFEDNVVARQQIWWHQRYLAAFRSRGSSANNHVIAEAAGQLTAALAFDWFRESERWSVSAAALLEAELAKNTFRSGVNREMAFDYHGFVAELGLLAASEAQLAGRPVSERSWSILCQMLDVIASVLDAGGRAPRQGDSDDGRALILGCPDSNRWTSLLALGRAVFGAQDWWPESDCDATSILVASIAGTHPRADRPARRESHFADAGLTIIRSAESDGKEIWCRCDAGPHGFLSIAAHAHADALAVEVRHDGVDILADPGTFCYNSEPTWRRYFKSTLAHNTVELGRHDQSRSGGPTLWLRHAQTTLTDLRLADDGRVTHWSAEHDGYQVLSPPAWHQRTVHLSSEKHRLEIVDRVKTDGRHTIRLAFHLGPAVGAVRLDGCVALRWTGVDGANQAATLSLPQALTWSMVRGSSDPPLGWYSPGFDRKHPSITVLGEGVCSGHDEFLSVLQFAAGDSTNGDVETD